MNLTDYQVWTRSTAIYPGNKAIEYLALGLTSEAGEVAGKVKKYVRDLAWDANAVIDELGDVFWYLVRLCDEMEVNPEYVLKRNHDKLESRKARNTLQGSGDTR